MPRTQNKTSPSCSHCVKNVASFFPLVPYYFLCKFSWCRNLCSSHFLRWYPHSRAVRMPAQKVRKEIKTWNCKISAATSHTHKIYFPPMHIKLQYHLQTVLKQFSTFLFTTSLSIHRCLHMSSCTFFMTSVIYSNLN